MAESITPEENTNTVMKNEFEYKAELLSALINSMQDEEVSISASMVKDTEAYRKGILNALNVEYTDDDVKHTSVFRSKVIDGVKNMSGGGGGGGLTDSTVNVNVTIPSEGARAIITTTCIGTAGQSTNRAYALVKEDRVGTVAYFCYNGNQTFDESQNSIYTVAIIERFRVNVTQGEITSVTGDAVWSEGQTYVTVNGDCTINITGN